MSKTATLIIDRWESRCSVCNSGADPYEKTHKTKYPGYSKEEGCGALFTTMRSNYIGLNMKQRCLEMRPDLEWVGHDE